jgi:hypothetical protein
VRRISREDSGGRDPKGPGVVGGLRGAPLRSTRQISTDPLMAGIAPDARCDRTQRQLLRVDEAPGRDTMDSPLRGARRGGVPFARPEIEAAH